MYPVLLHAHSAIRWLVVFSVLTAFILAVIHRNNSKEKYRKISMLSVYFSHLQFIAGILLYFFSPRVIFSSSAMHDPVSRFFLLEHPFAMLIVITLVTIGYSRMKKAADPAKASRSIIWFFGLSLLLLLTLIPWPFMPYHGHWI
jgi:hypothetical protein